MEIRQAAINDFELIKEIKLRAKKNERRYNRSLKPVDKNRKTYLSYFRNDLTNKKRAVFVAIERGKPIGIITGRIHTTLLIRTLREKGHISNLYVRPGHRRKGVATELIRRTLKWFREKKIKDIGLGTYVKNKSIRGILRKFGFKECAIEMKKRL